MSKNPHLVKEIEALAHTTPKRSQPLTPDQQETVTEGGINSGLHMALHKLRTRRAGPLPGPESLTPVSDGQSQFAEGEKPGSSVSIVVPPEVGTVKRSFRGVAD